MDKKSHLPLRRALLVQYLKPGLADFPNYLASGGITTAASPDGNTLLVLTAGYNNLDDSSGNF